MIKWFAPTKLMPTAISADNRQTRGSLASLLNLQQAECATGTGARARTCTSAFAAEEREGEAGELLDDVHARLQIHIALQYHDCTLAVGQDAGHVRTDAAKHVQEVAHHHHLVLCARQDGVEQARTRLQLA